jgi:glycosyltransferase involved in cell wall biosynthesis
LNGCGPLCSILTGIETVWSSRSFREVKALIAGEKPDIAHFHNIVPLISPAAYYACGEAGIPVVQTLHNYRLLCPGGLFLRDGKVCEECLGRSVPWPGVAHACYRQSRPATAAIAAMQVTHRALGTWRDKVDLYIALSEFARQKFIEGGLPPDRIVVKPNFVDPDPGPKQDAGAYALFVGRLSAEKGLNVLLSAWKRLRDAIPLRIAGDGPLRNELSIHARTKGMRGVELLGQIAPQAIASLMRGARFLVLPSLTYENFPLTVAEAFACGVPVIASRLGSLAEIVTDGLNGLHFSPGDPEDLAAKVGWAWKNPRELSAMGRAGRHEFEEKCTPAANYKRLMQIYSQAIAKHSALASVGEK